MGVVNCILKNEEITFQFKKKLQDSNRS